MRSRSLQGRAIATVAVLAALLAGTATLRAAIGERAGSPAARAELTATGAVSLSNSKEGAAIFDLASIGPGDGGQGEVTIANTGTTPGTLSLASLDRSDSPGTYGGALSQRLMLVLEDVSTATAAEVYSGQLGAMPELQLGNVAGGESRTYRFRITMLDGGPPSSPFVDDNVYQGASASLGYEWTLTEVEGGGAEPPETPPAQPPPTQVAQSPPAESPKPASELTGTPDADRLIGDGEDNVIYGRGGADRIFGMGGRDYLVGGSGADRIHGGTGGDRLRGGVGSDHIDGGRGPDAIFARDGEADLIDCGSGRDTTYVDERDRARNCESVSREYGRLFPGGMTKAPQ